MIRRTAILLVLLSACRGSSGAPASQAADPPPSAAPAAAPTGPAVVINRRPGALRMDTARVMMAGPLVSTAGWTAFQVSYQTNLDLADSAALAAQSDSVFASVRVLIAQRPDTAAFMEAHFPPGSEHGGYRFLYHKLPNGAWERVP